MDHFKIQFELISEFYSVLNVFNQYVDGSSIKSSDFIDLIEKEKIKIKKLYFHTTSEKTVEITEKEQITYYLNCVKTDCTWNYEVEKTDNRLSLKCIRAFEIRKLHLYVESCEFFVSVNSDDAVNNAGKFKSFDFEKTTSEQEKIKSEDSIKQDTRLTMSENLSSELANKINENEVNHNAIKTELNLQPELANKINEKEVNHNAIKTELNLQPELANKINENEVSHNAIKTELNLQPELANKINEKEVNQNVAKTELNLELEPENKIHECATPQNEAKIGQELLSPEPIDKIPDNDLKQYTEKSEQETLWNNDNKAKILTVEENCEQEVNSSKESLGKGKSASKNLWKDIPCSTDMPYFKPNTKNLGYDVLEGRKIIGASIRGRSHAHEGLARDDDFGFLVTENCKWKIVVVSDGAGSAKFSRRGSELVCDSVIKYCKEILENGFSEINTYVNNLELQHYDGNKSIPPKVLHEIKILSYKVVVQAAFFARKDIEREVIFTKEKFGQETTIKDFSTTCLILVTKKCSFGELVISFSIGDGAIACIVPNQTEPYLLSMVDSGEYAGQTNFITTDSIFRDSSILFNQRLQVRVFNCYEAIVVMTDGVSDPFFDVEDNLKDNCYWNSFWKNLTHEGQEHLNLESDSAENNSQLLLNWLNFYKQGYHDDRTIVVVY